MRAVILSSSFVCPKQLSGERLLLARPRSSARALLGLLSTPLAMATGASASRAVPAPSLDTSEYLETRSVRRPRPVLCFAPFPPHTAIKLAQGLERR